MNEIELKSDNELSQAIEMKLKLQKDSRDWDINLTITKQAGVCNPCRRKNQDNSPKDIYLINQAVNYCYDCALFTMNNIDSKPEIGGINKHEQINEVIANIESFKQFGTPIPGMGGEFSDNQEQKIENNQEPTKDWMKECQYCGICWTPQLDEHWMTNAETKQAFCGECFLKVSKIKGNVKLAQAVNTHQGEEISKKTGWEKIDLGSGDMNKAIENEALDAQTEFEKELIKLNQKQTNQTSAETNNSENSAVNSVF